MFRSISTPAVGDGEPSPAEQAARVKELAGLIGPLEGREKTYCTEACLRRYLRARNWNVKKAEKMLRDSLKWRAQFKPEEIRWEDIAHEAETGKIYRTTFLDKLGRSVLVMAPGRQNTNDHDGQMRHLSYCLENAILTLPEGQEKIVWIVDFRGWSLKKSPPMKTARETLNILQNQYPERLGLAIVYDPPQLFQTFWKLIRPFIDPVTFNKIKFIYSNKPETHSVMLESFDLAKLDKSFGGEAHMEFDVNEYAERMREDDRKMAALWGLPLVRNGDTKVTTEQQRQQQQHQVQERQQQQQSPQDSGTESGSPVTGTEVYPEPQTVA